MNKEKIKLGNQTELSYDSIAEQGGLLQISVVGGDLTAIETFFGVAQENLEKIIQTDSEGTVQRVWKNYDIFRSIRKDKDVVIDEVTEEKADIITVTLEQESDLAIAVRKLKANEGIQDGAIAELGEIVSTVAQAQGISL